MKIDEKTLKKIAHLARLEVEEKEVPKLMEEMTRMLDFVEKLNAVNTEGVEPLTTMSFETNVFREDEVKTELTREEALKNAPQKDNNYFRVPKVLE